MKKTFKKITLVFTAAIMTFALAACGAPKTPPTDVAKLYLDAILYQKIDELNAHTGLNETFDDFYGEFNKGITEGFGGTAIDEKSQKELADALLQALNKVTYTVEGESIDKDTATVAVLVTGIDFDRMLGDMTKELEALALSGAITSEEQAMQMVIPIMVKALQNAPLVETPVPANIVLNKIDNKWGVSDEGSLETLLTSAIIVTRLA